MSTSYVLRSSGVAVLRILNPPVNGLSKGVREGLVAGFKQATKDHARCVVLGGDGRTFPAGADIKEFSNGKFRECPDLVAVLEEMDKTDIPLIAAIHGTALGGGFETALACDTRICHEKALVGLPEVHLGILPGAGGTQRLPRLVGRSKALEIIISGKPMNMRDATQLGVVDLVIETSGDFIDRVADWAEKNTIVKRKVSDLPTPSDDGWNVDSVLENTKSKPVNLKNIVKAIDASSLSFNEGMEQEQKLFDELINHPHAKALQYMFFSERTKPIKDPKPVPIQSVGVIGGGTMGRGIAMCFLNKGIPVTLVETNSELARGTTNAVRDTYKRSRTYNEVDCERKMSLFGTSTSMNDLGNADVIIEAVFENLDLKKSIFSQLGKIAKDDALLCTNTSYLDIDEIAVASGKPEKVIGTHFFSPANVMPLLENVRGKHTSKQSISTAMNMGSVLGKKTVLAGNCFGFIGNRMFEPYTQQAICLVEEGASPSMVDSAMTDLGMAMGPLAVLDLAGNDIPYRIRKEPYYPHADTAPGRQSWRFLADGLVDAGRLGQKSGRGWYAYPKARTQIEDPLLDELLFSHRKTHNISVRTDISKEEIQERCLFPMVNEGLRILEEGIAGSPQDIDIVWTSGYGFPRYLGGPMFHATNVIGMDVVEKALLKYKSGNCGPEWHFNHVSKK